MHKFTYETTTHLLNYECDGSQSLFTKNIIISCVRCLQLDSFLQEITVLFADLHKHQTFNLIKISIPRFRNTQPQCHVHALFTTLSSTLRFCKTIVIILSQLRLKTVLAQNQIQVLLPLLIHMPYQAFR